VSSFKPQQRRLTINDRNFHFVCYEGSRVKPNSGDTPEPPTWYLMVEGRRCRVMPYTAEQSQEELDAALIRWAESNALIGDAEEASEPSYGSSAPDKGTQNWWGPV